MVPRVTVHTWRDPVQSYACIIMYVYIHIYEFTENYDRLLVTAPEQKELGEELRSRLRATTTAVLQLAGHTKLQQDNPVRLSCAHSLSICNMYV